MRKDFTTMIDALQYLNEQGYTVNFNLLENCIESKHDKITLPPDMFEVVDFFRFEGESNPDDSSIVYAIEAKNGMKGVLVNAYGVYSDPVSDEMVAKLMINRDDG